MPRDEDIGKPGRDLARDQGVLPVATPARHHIVSLVQLVHEATDVGGIVLQIPVERHHHLRAGRVESRRQGGGLSEVARQPDCGQVGARSGRVAQNRRRPIVAAVVDQDGLRLDAVCGQIGDCSVQLGQKMGQRFRFVVAGDDDGNRARAVQDFVMIHPIPRAPIPTGAPPFPAQRLKARSLASPRPHSQIAEADISTLPMHPLLDA